MIGANGTLFPVVPSNPKKGWKNEELYNLLHTEMVEVIHLDDDSWEYPIFICDEEAHYNNKPFNPVASKMVGFAIHGDVLLCESKQYR